MHIKEINLCVKTTYFEINRLMENMRTSVILVSLCVVVVCSEYRLNSKCPTPEGRDGTCIALDECDKIKPIITAARLRNETAIALARAYHCGHYGNTHLFCCDDVRSTPTTSPTPATDATGSSPNFHQPITLRDFNSTDIPDRSVCGLSRPVDKILGGERTKIDEFPWTAAIQFVRRKDGADGGVRCGGSLVNEQYVVTAAHCIHQQEFKIDKVRLGEWNTQTDPDCYEDGGVLQECSKVQIFNVEKQIPHEFYMGRYASNDIGLLKLDGIVTYTKFIKPICLPPPDLELASLYTYMTVVGWGQTENATRSNYKLKVDVPLVSNRVCKEKIPSRPITKYQYCVGGELNKDSCVGDSGGPLMRLFRNKVFDRDQWFLEGIVGSGMGCGRLGTPGIYTRVTEYTGWIVDMIAEERRKAQRKNV